MPASSKSKGSFANVTISERTPLLDSSSPSVSDSGDDREGRGDEGEIKEVDAYTHGKSSFSQTLLNILGDIIGTGLLACPIAFAHAGWVFGPLFMALIGALTLFTLKLLLRIIEKDRRLRSFTDVIGYGLGKTGQDWVTVLFVLEVAAWIIALVVLFSDTLEVVWPVFTSNQWKVVGLIPVLITSFVPLRFLAFSSALGITATWTLVAILVFTGIVTDKSPGSLRDPAHTDLLPSHGLAKLATVFGLLLSGFGGHGLIPNLIRDMKNPKQADRACEWAYAIAMAVYLMVAICGYIMYGTNVSDEISKDLARTPGFSPLLNTMGVWMVAINPLTKIPLGLRPLSDIVFTYFNLHPTVVIPKGAQTPRYVTRPSSSTALGDDEDLQETLPDPIDTQIHLQAQKSHDRKEKFKAFIRPMIRIFLAIAAILAGIVFPSFESVLSVLGSGFGLVTTVIIPILAFAKLEGWKWWYIAICVFSGIMAVLGTLGSFTTRIEY